MKEGMQLFFNKHSVAILDPQQHVEIPFDSKSVSGLLGAHVKTVWAI